MNCPICGGKTKVAYTAPDCESVQRQRQCKECNYMFYTAEYESDGKQLQVLLKEKGRQKYLKRKRRNNNDCVR